MTNNHTRDRLDIASRVPSHTGGLRLEERVAVLRERLEARVDSHSVERTRSVVREARGHVLDWKPSAVAESTSARYLNEVSKMSASGQTPEDARCKSTFEFQRAAVVYDARREIKKSLTELDRAKRGGDLDRAAEAFNRVQGSLEVLRRYPPSSGDRKLDLERSSAYHGPSHSDPDRSNGKRVSISQMPSDWRDMVQREVRDEDKSAVAAMSLTGARPAELKGIKVLQDEDSVRFEIAGAKVDESRGIKTRVISIEKSELEKSQAGRDLQSWLGNREVRTVSYSGSLPAFRERVNRSFDRSGLEEGSSYSFRHQAARDLKNEGHDNQEVANRLGHRSRFSPKKYG